MKEATVIVDGVELTQAQVMTMRVALSSFATDMTRPGVLGEDKHGEKMRALYLTHSREIEKMLVDSANNSRATGAKT